MRAQWPDSNNERVPAMCFARYVADAEREDAELLAKLGGQLVPHQPRRQRRRLRHMAYPLAFVLAIAFSVIWPLGFAQ